MRAFFILISALWANTAAAQTIDFWSQHDNWRFETFRYDDGRKFCMATAQNGPGYLGFADDGANQTLLLQRHDWNFTNAIALEISVDETLKRTLSDIPAEGQSIYVPILPTSVADQDLITTLATGTSALVKTEQGRHEWNLGGFAESRAELAECVRALKETAIDFATVAVVERVAGELQTPLTFREWTVDVIQDGPNALCSATVRGEENALHIYGGIVAGLYVRFLDPSWDFEPGKTDVQIRVDRRADWKIGNAQQNQTVIDIGAPENEDSKTFLENLKGGNWVYLHAKSGRELGSWSLAGSSDAIDAWLNCVTSLRR